MSKHQADFSARLTAVRSALKSAGVDALWVSQPENVNYLSGFSSPEDAKALILPDAAWLYTDGRYTLQAAQESAIPVFIARSPETLQHAAPLLSGLKVGFEMQHLTVAELGALQAHWPTEPAPLSGVVERLRLIKSDAEVQLIEQAQAIADAAFAELLPMVKVGAREQDLALALESAMRRLGADGPAFETIVASGVRGALPHGRASDKVLAEGELVTIDFGARLGGYFSDSTRTLALGEVSESQRRMYTAVLEAEETALAAIKPGVRTADLDALAREVLGRYDLADAFVHSLGHGVGLNVHEGPGLRSTSEEVLQAGMVITIEPGVYIEHLGGVRIEDLVLVTDEGSRVLSHSPKERF
ncbi:aminopeptidase P family protein [Deinococcus psychrotolerans]|uniref:Aminopeptidase P family protein n=1 Tax=Deinococcus psychrotolerans TaxID=2489213 RepID=A0A3G8YA31_9DEIO|nr:Xaa-Pro peptidase family protein [Deinococcus psychrotolerans]AZI41790.1 aminopeptidase P family protein [Deinococcus psychrotolerans]